MTQEQEQLGAGESHPSTEDTIKEPKEEILIPVEEEKEKEMEENAPIEETKKDEEEKEVGDNADEKKEQETDKIEEKKTEEADKIKEEEKKIEEEENVKEKQTYNNRIDYYDDDDEEEDSIFRDGIDESSWFEHIVGVSEPEFRKNLSKYIKVDNFVTRQITSKPVCPCDGMNISIGEIESGKEKHLSNAGTFYFPTIADLRTAASMRKKIKSVAKECTFYVDTNTTGTHDDDVDICALQANPDNAGALFQVASNLNTIESIDETVSPDTSETYVTDCIYYF